MMGNLNAYLGPFTQALDLRTHRQQVLASNIANADTPYYKARDFDFKEAYAAARGKREEGGQLALSRTHAAHLPLTAGGTLDAVNLQYRTEYQSAVDGNTVDMDVERAEITDNALQYQILTNFVSDKFRGLRSAIASNQGG
ncbi:flagellar basal body rod protein FlgB [Betaproteobacteria bacterium]|nr:flagellar basal body rod protein FlgB [Betaproteobacteria bacterium]GHU10533.1 flagellar basal body rod protein FlgB [Betaproteobacteria bacterium]GHU13325.1 flagellar basal body rod protein FlgB [Betaproteobacteria bacterium]GHU46954.1 flagellar basal body rod protein FlgB [Betaproteobacteria bacterium]